MTTSHRPRIGVACPVTHERTTLCDWLLTGGFEPVPLTNEMALARAFDGPPIEALVVDRALVDSGAVARAMRARGVQRPMVVVGSGEAAGRRASLAPAMSVTRPVAEPDLLLAVSLALAEGRPARRSPRVPVARLASMVDSVPAQLLDVSEDGLRLELSEQHRLSLARTFTVRVPAYNVSVVATRVWVAPAAAGRRGRVWCGASLTLAGSQGGEAWRRLMRAAAVSPGRIGVHLL